MRKRSGCIWYGDLDYCYHGFGVSSFWVMGALEGIYIHAINGKLESDLIIRIIIYHKS